MSLFLGKKQSAPAMAELLEAGCEMAEQEMKKLKYKSYKGTEPVFHILVSVQPENEPSFEARMEAGLGQTFLLRRGVRMRVKYEPGRQAKVKLDDKIQAILDRNPQLRKSQ
jgi:hypothetical protein